MNNLVVTVDVDILLNPMRNNTQDLIARPDQPQK